MNITVFCGSKFGANPAFKEAARELGQWIGQKGHRLVYGGATNGLMGVLADSCLQAGGQVIGIVPDDIKNFEDWHPDLSQLIEVKDLTERKFRMAQEGHAFIALPGGPGTLEEIVDMISWSRVKLHNKPCILYNVDGYYDLLVSFLDQMVQAEFISQNDLSLVHSVENLGELETFLKLV